MDWKSQTHDQLLSVLKNWGYDNNIRLPNGVALYEFVSYLHDGIDNVSDVLSNYDGYFRLVEQRDRVLLFNDEMFLICVWTDVSRVWRGVAQDDPLEKTWTTDDTLEGNTCLLQVRGSNTHRYVRGGLVLEFLLDEEVQHFYSYVANNEVPHALVVTQNYLYVPEDQVRLRRSDVPSNLDLRNKFVEYFYILDEVEDYFECATLIDGQEGD